MMLKALRNYVANLDSDLRNYRLSMKRVFVRRLTQPRHCARYFFEILVSTSRLYGHYLTLRQMEPTIPTQQTAKRQTAKAAWPLGGDEEFEIRKKFRTRIESLACWSEFHPMNAFEEENQLRTQADYIFALVLHLPEIYGETFALDGYLRTVRAEGGFSGSSLVKLLVGLQHAAHHASYCRHALEILSEESSWQTFTFQRPLRVPDGPSSK